MKPDQDASATLAAVSGDLTSELAALQELDLYALRVRWRKLMRREAPDRLGRTLLLRLVAYKLQARLHGDLDTDSVKYLERVATDRIRRRTAGEIRPKAVPPVPAVPARHGVKPGTQFLREFGNEVHLVTTVADGFAWKGQVYNSLSEIARLITGSQWSGPRFFGLKQKSGTAPSPEGGA